ncbi:MAG: hypothetical protein EPN61_14970 [Burkholderiaceae bacterium]|nr:MAG: hypothetical protein EPN61_14970 [Burkholderiaceae bacterium]
MNLAVSEAASCDYCVAAHTFIGQFAGLSQEATKQVRAGTGTRRAGNGLYEPATANTIIDLGRFKDLLEEAYVNGFAWADSEYYNGDINISAPILDPKGTPVAAVNISAASSRFTLAQAKTELGPQVIETARAISGSSAVQQLQIMHKFRKT